MILSNMVHIIYGSAGTKKKMHEWKTAMCWGWCGIIGDFYVYNFYLVLLYCFLITALFRYDSYSIKFTILKHTIQWFLVYSQSCA